MIVTPQCFEEILPRIMQADTSADPEAWSKENPHWGHCAVVSALAQTVLGPDWSILRSSLKGTSFSQMGSHYANISPEGELFDFTRAQFGNTPVELTWAFSSLEYILRDPETGLFRPDSLRRFVLLQERFWREILMESRI